MHLHTHLLECILDFGLPHSFWLFPFERFNGILGQQPNNNRSIEIQLMNRFIRDNDQMSMKLSEQFEESFSPIFRNRRTAGTVLDTDNSIILPLSPLDIEETDDWSIDSARLLNNVEVPSQSTRGVLSNAERDRLRILYSRLYSVPYSEVELSSTFHKYKSLLFNGRQLGSHLSRVKSSSIVMCAWDPILSPDNAMSSGCCEDRPARINFFC